MLSDIESGQSVYYILVYKFSRFGINAADYITVDGLHEPLVSAEVWNKAQEKRQLTGKKFASKYGKDRTHLLTGLLKFPVCGGPMYANRHYWTKRDGTYKEVGYYVCGRNKHDRGKLHDMNARLDGMYEKIAEIEELIADAPVITFYRRTLN